MEVAVPAKTLVTAYYPAPNHTPEDSNGKITVYYENRTQIILHCGGKIQYLQRYAGDTCNNEGASKAYIYKNSSSLHCMFYGPPF